MKRRIRSHLLLAAAVACALLLLSACAAPRQAVRPQTEPNAVSAFFFSAATILYNEGYYPLAENIYRMALRHDSGALEIKRGIFNSLLQQVNLDQLPLERFAAFADSLQRRNELDPPMLELAYRVYFDREQYRRAARILELYMQKTENAQAYTSLFFLEQQMDKKARPELLDRAAELAGTDAALLNSIGYFYLEFDPDRAERIWWQAAAYDTTTQAAGLLWTLYADRRDESGLLRVFRSFTLPRDQDRLAELLGGALDTGNYASVLALQEPILATNDPQLIIRLLLAGWFAEDEQAFGRCLQALRASELEPSDRQLIIFFQTLQSLLNDDLSGALRGLTSLDGKESLDNLVALYRSRLLEGPGTDSTAVVSEVRNNLRELIRSDSSRQLPWQVRDYLLAVADGLNASAPPSAADLYAKPLVLFYYESYRRTYETYVWLGQHYQKMNNEINLKTVLREALDEYPQNADLLNWLGYAYARVGINLKEAEVLILRALQLDPDNPYYLDSLAWVYFMREDYNKALDFMVVPSQMENMPSEIAYHLGHIHLALENYSSAIAYLKLCVEVNDDPVSVAQARKLLDQLEP